MMYAIYEYGQNRQGLVLTDNTIAKTNIVTLLIQCSKKMNFFDKNQIIKNKVEFEGINSISEIDLLAIIYGRGDTSENAYLKATEIVNKFESIDNFNHQFASKLKSLKPKDKLFVESLIELSTRFKLQSVEEIEIINTSSDIVKIFTPKIGSLSYEELWVVCMNSANRVIDKICLSKGGDNQSIFDIKLLMKKLLNNLCNSIILVHNHPNQNHLPSPEDISITKKVKEATAYFDINLLDHIIITKDNYYSLTENNDI